MKKIILSTFLLGTFLSADAQRELKWVTTLDSINTNVDVLNESNNTREFLQLDIKNNQLGIFATSNNNPFNANLNASDGKVKYENVKSASETIAGICFDKQGNLYSLYSPGWSGWGTANYDSYLRKLNQSGQIVFNNTVNNYTVDFLRQITSSVDSGLFLYGINRNGSNGYLSHSIYKINPSGAVAFSNTISVLDWYAGSPGKFALDKSGIVFSAKRQTSQYNENTYDIVLRKVDNKGTQLWQVYYDYNSLCDYIEDLKIDKNGDVYITTNSHNAPNWGTSTRRIVKINGSNGNKIYERKIGETAGRNDIKIINNNLYVAVGYDSILCINPATGKTNWKLGLGTTYNYRSFYIDKNDKLYVVGANGVKRYSSTGVLDDSFRVKNTTYTFNHYGIQIDTLDNLYLYGEKVKGSGSKIFIAKFGCKNRNSFLGVDKKVCGKDSIQISASNGMKSYSWNNSAITKSIFVKSSENFICTQTDSSGCLSRDTISVSIINGKISPRDTIVCSLSTVNLSTIIPKSNFVACGLPVSTVNLDGYWPFCGDAKDRSSTSNDGTVNGATLVNDRFGNSKSAYSFDGNDYISLKDPFFGGSSKVSAFTYSVWVSPSTLNGDMIISSKEGYWRTKGFGINAAGEVSFGGSDPSPQGYLVISSPSNTITANKWFHIVVTYDSSNLKLFVNNKLITKQKISYSVLDYSYLATGNSTSTNYIGATHPVSPGITAYFKGIIDELAIWSRALTLNEISNLYQTNSTSTKWSTGDTASTIKYSVVGKNKVWVSVSDGIGTCTDTTTVTVSNPKVTITSIDSVHCFQGADGSVIASVTGGISPYSYKWDDATSQNTSQAKNLKKGIYKVTVTDTAKCIDTISAIVNEPAKVTLAINAIDSVNCYQGSDGSIATSISGGSSGYKYQWNDGAKQTSSKASSLKKGTYKVIVKDLYGCSDSITGTVNEPAKVVLTITAIDSVNCFQGSDGSITTSIAGGSKGFKYQWNDPSKQITSKASNLKKGVYKLIAKDIYGCSDSITGTISEPAKVVISITNIDSAFCYGYSDGAIATSTKGGTGAYKWNWNTSPIQTTSKSIGLKKGNYKVIVKDVYGCSDSIMGTVNEPEQIVPKITINRLTMLGMSHELYADITPVKKYQYLWTPLSTFNGLNTQPRPRVIFNITTKVGLQVTDYKGCKGYDTATITVVQPIKNIIPTGFTPNADNLNEGFGLPDIFEIQTIEIYDRWGGIIFKGSSTSPRWDGRLNGELVPAGVYAYTLQAQLKGTDQIVKHGGSITLIK